MWNVQLKCKSIKISLLLLGLTTCGYGALSRRSQKVLLSVARLRSLSLGICMHYCCCWFDNDELELKMEIGRRMLLK